MAKENLLMEIGCEEVPSRFMPETLKNLQEEAVKMLRDYRLDFIKVETFGTPRRFVLLVEGLVAGQEDLEEKKKGPAQKIAFDAAGKPSKAAQGFAKGQGLEVKDLTIEEVEGVKYVFALTKILGQKTTNLLPKLIPELIQKISFPKPMFWEKREVRFARPIRWLSAVYGKEVVDFSYGGVISRPETMGHRFLSPGPHRFNSSEEYFTKLKNAYVVVDPKERQEQIIAKSNDAASALGGKAVIEEDLLNEVVYLVEYPNAVAGSFDKDHLKLPREVLVTTMQNHQRYFPVEDENGKLLPYFITIANGIKDFTDNVRSGNEKVLRARLADAGFFYKEDLKSPLKDKAEKLKDIVYQVELGSIYDKVLRLKDLTLTLSTSLNLSEKEKNAAISAASLSKADLVTSMVNEFPELQGIMGREYALNSGEGKEVSKAIYEHYLPRFAGDDVPESTAGAVVALTDKLDNIVASFSLGKEPSGSQDPYALRRQALGVIAILRSKEISLVLDTFLGEIYERLSRDAKVTLQEKDITISKVWDFILQRAKFILLEEGLPYDIIDALFSSPLRDINLMITRAIELQRIVEGGALKGLLEAYTRVANLAEKAAKEVKVKEELLTELQEKNLYSDFIKAKQEGEKLLAQGDFCGFLTTGAALRPSVDAFFEAVMVMVEEENICANRLALLKEIKDFFFQAVDLSKIT